MKVHLLFPDHDPDPAESLPDQADDLVRDLGMDALFDQMAAGDDFLREVACRTVLRPLTNVNQINHRLDVIEDVIAHPDVARELYQVAVTGAEAPRRVRSWVMKDSPSSALTHAINLMHELICSMRQLHRIAAEHEREFRSTGLSALCATLRTDLAEDYITVIEDHLERLKFADGVVLTAALGDAGKGDDYVLRNRKASRRGWRGWLGLAERSELTYRVPDRDEAGGRALRELKDRGINRVADALSQSSDHVLSFFTMLRWELGFYLCCLNLADVLAEHGLAWCRPQPRPIGCGSFTAEGLYDVYLGLRIGPRTVVNDVNADGCGLVVVTGANEGGRSTLLRSIGLAQLLMQSGMFVPADSLRADIAAGLHTHFKREEDAGMERGRLDDELARVSVVIDAVSTGGLVLFNESFSSTNEREGSEIARQVIDGLLDAGVRVVVVTHMYQLAHGFDSPERTGVLFLLAERCPDGRRTFKLVEGRPRSTSFGAALYRQVFHVPCGS